MKRVLIITYHYSPEATVGATRPTKFSIFLPNFGWEAIVLSVKTRYYPAIDGTAKVPDVKIFRTGLIPNPREVFLKMRGLYWRWRGLEKVIQERRLQADREPFAAKQQRPADLYGRARCFLLSLLYLPDDRLGWVPPAVLTGARLVKKFSLDAIITSGPPHSAHLIGLLLKRWFRVRWVADFRDPWSLNQLKAMSIRSEFSDRLDRLMEREVVSRADSVVATTEDLCEALRVLYPDLPADRFVTVTNGFDQQDFAGLSPISNRPCFLISQAGSLYHQRSPESFFAALSVLFKERRIPRDDVFVNFMGSWDDGLDVTAMAAAAGISDVVRVKGLVPRREALQSILESDLLVLFAQNQRLHLPGKVFEYLASGADILALTSEGAAANFLVRIGRGTVVPPNDVAKIAEAVERCYIGFRRGETRSRPRPAIGDPAIAGFEWGRLTEDLVACLERK